MIYCIILLSEALKTFINCVMSGFDAVIMEKICNKVLKHSRKSGEAKNKVYISKPGEGILFAKR